MFVLPSSSDGFSLTLAEAMSCGTPAITVNRAGPGSVAHGFAYTIEEPGVEELADAIEKVLLDEQLKSQLRVKELERAQAFSWQHTARQTLDVLRKVSRN